MRTLLAVSTLLVYAVSAPCDISVFFSEVYDRHGSSYTRSASDEYSGFCLEHQLEVGDSMNQRTFHEIRFLHDLLTGSSAVNCATGGMLQIPYFWHWVDPNPRHLILSLPDSVALSSLEPPSGYGRYRSLADVDRVPVLFLADLVSERPAYWHPGCGEFFTFGWCSEREMAFLALAEAQGHHGRIQQSGIHSWSELWCRFRGLDGATRGMVARVDNTFDSVVWFAPPEGMTLSDWQAAVGQSREVRWYNEQAHSEEQREGLRAIEVGPLAASRIDSQVMAALECGSGAGVAPRPN